MSPKRRGRKRLDANCDTSSVTVQVTDRMHDEAIRLSKLRDVSVAWLFREAFYHWFQRNKPTENSLLTRHGRY